MSDRKSFLYLIDQVLQTAKQLQASNSQGNRDEASRRASYSLDGIHWVNDKNGAMLKLRASFDTEIMEYTAFLELTKDLPEHTFVRWKKFLGLKQRVGQSEARESVEVQWQPGWFKVNQVDPTKVIELLEAERLQKGLSHLSRPEYFLWWVRGVDHVKVDDKTDFHLCLKDDCDVCTRAVDEA